jgi:Tol biopolymer transport system component
VLISPTGGAETVAYVNKERGCVILDDWSPDGRFITFNRDPSLMALPLTGDRTPFPYVQTANANLDESHFSPDGKWIAYNSNESGTWQVYLAPFPPQGERWQISAGGGVEVRWRGDGRELYYLTLDGQMMAVDVGLGSKPTIGQARMLFQSGITVGTRNDQYAVSNDGQRFLLRRQVVANGRLPLNVVLNWHAELR